MAGENECLYLPPRKEPASLGSQDGSGSLKVGGWGREVNPLKKAEEAPALSVEVALWWI